MTGRVWQLVAWRMMRGLGMSNQSGSELTQEMTHYDNNVQAD